MKALDSIDVLIKLNASEQLEAIEEFVAQQTRQALIAYNRWTFKIGNDINGIEGQSLEDCEIFESHEALFNAIVEYYGDQLEILKALDQATDEAISLSMTLHKVVDALENFGNQTIIVCEMTDRAAICQVRI